MDSFKDWLIGFASEPDHPAGFALLAASGLLEYLIPPWPGDTITLLGAVLITAYGWSAIGIFAAVLAGSIAGLLLHFALGRKLRARGQKRPRVERIVARFERHGPIYLVINRFLPGIRAFVFVAAGMSGMRARHVLLYGSISVALWNGLLIGVGAAVGANLETLERWFRAYNTWAWITIGAAVAAFGAWHLVGRWRRRRPGPERE